MFDPASAHKLEDPERLTWLPPGEVLARLGLRSGETVADIGAGTGYFAIPIAREIGPSGKVVAVDAQAEMLALLRRKLDGPEAPRNIEAVEGDAVRTGLPDDGCDLVLLANLWHELPDGGAALREADRILRPGGRLAILDWRPDVEQPPGPPLDHRVTAEQVVHQLEHGGWSLHYRGDAGRYHYLLLATVADQGQQS
jgi:ubiquinone/menaquinone biosynthesis C-methylase UbiE